VKNSPRAQVEFQGGGGGGSRAQALRIPGGDEQQLSYDPKSGRFIYTVKRGNNIFVGRAVGRTFGWREYS
jgi:hypothetical protein